MMSPLRQISTLWLARLTSQGHRSIKSPTCWAVSQQETNIPREPFVSSIRTNCDTASLLRSMELIVELVLFMETVFEFQIFRRPMLHTALFWLEHHRSTSTYNGSINCRTVPEHDHNLYFALTHTLSTFLFLAFGFGAPRGERERPSRGNLSYSSFAVKHQHQSPLSSRTNGPLSLLCGPCN